MSQMEDSMTNEELIKALRYCGNSLKTGCKGCPLWGKPMGACFKIVTAAADALEADEKRIDEGLRRNIDECYDGSAWEAVTGILGLKGRTPFRIWKFEKDVEYEHKMYRCLIIEKCVYDADDISAVDYAETIYEDAWEI